MKIIKPGCLEFADADFVGECKICGCVFETTVGVSQRPSRKLFQNKDNLMAMEIDSRTGVMSCICPSCMKCRVKLTEK